MSEQLKGLRMLRKKVEMGYIITTENSWPNSVWICQHSGVQVVASEPVAKSLEENGWEIAKYTILVPKEPWPEEPIPEQSFF